MTTALTVTTRTPLSPLPPRGPFQMRQRNKGPGPLDMRQQVP